MTMFFGALWLLSSHLLYACEPQEQNLRESLQFEVHWQLYPSESNSLEAVIILPPTGGSTWIDRSYAEDLCERGLDVYVLSSWSNQDEEALELEVHDRLLGRAQKAIALLRSSEALQDRKVHLIGTSVGGLHALIAKTNSPDDFAQTVFIVAGAPMSEVIARSELPLLRTYRQKRMKAYGFDSQEEYAQALSQKISVRADRSTNIAASTYAIWATDDDWVPTSTQKNVLDHWKPTQQDRVSGGHRFAIFRAWLFHRDDIVDHIMGL